LLLLRQIPPVVNAELQMQETRRRESARAQAQGGRASCFWPYPYALQRAPLGQRAASYRSGRPASRGRFHSRLGSVLKSKQSCVPRFRHR
jgi:hypothetical protein